MNMLEFTRKHCHPGSGSKMQSFVQDLATVDTKDWGKENDSSASAMFVRAKKIVLGAGGGASVLSPPTSAAPKAVAPTPAPPVQPVSPPPTKE